MKTENEGNIFNKISEYTVHATHGAYFYELLDLYG